MMTHNIKKVLIALLPLLFIASSMYAQKKSKAPVKKPATEHVATIEEINYTNLLPATAKLMFIDSVIVDMDKIYDYVCIASSCGKLMLEKKDNHTDYTYTNDFNTVRYMSIADEAGVHKLYMQNRIGRKWTDPQLVTIEDDVTDIICPYLMPDGVTLYFSALGGEDNVGAHDLFYTTYDSDSHTFYRPQSLGLPYNSMSDDICCIIDDINNIGHLITTRNQPEGKACIYTFETKDSRETYDAEIDVDTLAAFAAIHSIKATQTDANALASAKMRLTNLRSASENANNKDFTFVINGSRVYHQLSDFHSPSNAERYQSYASRLAELKQTESLLSEMRAAYHKGDKSNAKEIISLEKNLMKERKALADLEKQIRNAELIK